jgi:two-component system sensor histidine kinase KdpD
MNSSLALGSQYWLRKLRVPGQCLLSCVSLGLLTYGGFVLGANLLTMSYLYLLLIVAVAFFFGFWQASFASLLAVLLLDYYFAQPLFSFEIADARDWVALATFELTALTIGRLHKKEQRCFTQATLHRREMEQLHELSRN